MSTYSIISNTKFNEAAIGEFLKMQLLPLQDIEIRENEPSVDKENSSGAVRDLNACIFEIEALHRLEHVREFLRDAGKGVSSAMALLSIRALVEESVQFCRKDIAEICSWIERNLILLQMGDCKNPSGVIAGISSACDRIEEETYLESCRSSKLHSPSTKTSNAA
jgi:hypothetical protein